MISVCVLFYPWQRGYDRTREVTEVLMPTLRACKKKEELELCILHMGCKDIYGMNRKHDPEKLLFDIKKYWKNNKLIFEVVEDEFIHPGPPENLWLSKAVNAVIMQSSSDRFLMTGIDITLPVYLVDIFNSIVEPKTMWILITKHVDAVNREFLSWRSNANGMIGMMKEDYIESGMSDESHVRDKYDNLFIRKARNTGIKLVKERRDDVMHIRHE
jgi:hypothetical protein